jgi:UDP-GlcNAc:undecaprenyl-phosphate GlcNAc-1-phosphate transferase
VTSIWLPAVVALSLSFLLTFLCRVVALRTGIISTPAADRWSARPVALLGGPAIVAATALSLGLVEGLPADVWILLAGAVSVSAVGLVDDVQPMAPVAKLTAQIVAAAAVTGAGLRFPLTGSPIVDTVITIAWIVGLTNAFNLLDNMDGLAAGIAAIVGVVKLLLFVGDGEWVGAAAAAAFSAACVGFLVHNLVPRRIFMGDAGSLFLGFFVAGLSTIGSEPASRVTMSVLVVPVVVMLVPIFDTVLVTVVRTLTGRRISQGGRDHVSHRLVTGGLSERGAVFTLYVLAALSGALAIATRGGSFYTGLVLLLTLGLAMAIFGVSLSRIAVYKSDTNPDAFARLLQLPGAFHYRDVANAGINAALVFVSFYSAYAFRYGSQAVLAEPAFVRALPAMLATKMLALALLGTYRSVWRYTDSRDLAALALASTVGSAFGVLFILFAYGFTDYSRVVFVLDWVLFTTLLASSRLSLRALSEILRPVPPGAIRVLIYGAGDAGVALLQELRRNPKHGRAVVGFLDDDPLKKRSRIQGLPVFGGVDDLSEAIAASAAQEIILAISDADDECVSRLSERCAAHRVPVNRFEVKVSIAGIGAELSHLD